jgi:hypothetical protein
MHMTPRDRGDRKEILSLPTDDLSATLGFVAGRPFYLFVVGDSILLVRFFLYSSTLQAIIVQTLTLLLVTVAYCTIRASIVVSSVWMSDARLEYCSWTASAYGLGRQGAASLNELSARESKAQLLFPTKVLIVRKSGRQLFRIMASDWEPNAYSEFKSKLHQGGVAVNTIDDFYFHTS